MEILGYQLSERFERFYEDKKISLCLERIVFLPMSDHPSGNQYRSAYGTTFLTDDGRTLQVFLNPNCFNQYPAEVRDYVAESIAIHEILHPWTKAQGFPEVRGDARCPAIGERFTNLFHHLVINREMDRLEYDHSITDRFVARQFVEVNTELKNTKGIPEYELTTFEFSLYAINYAIYYFQFPPDDYNKARQLICDTNPTLLDRSDQSVKAIEESRCWENPTTMFSIMKRVRNLVELAPNLLEIQNPDTCDWC